MSKIVTMNPAEQKPGYVRVNFFSQGFHVKAGEPYHEMARLDNIPLSSIKNAGKMIGKYNKELATIYYIELHSDIYHGTRREYSYDAEGCKEFEDQFPVFPYSDIKYRISQMEGEISSLRNEIVEMKDMIRSLVTN